MQKTNKLITHNGSFHADDIFAGAAFSILFEKRGEGIEIVRTRDEEVIRSGDYVFDVGGVYDEDANRFDHHQPGGAKNRIIAGKAGTEEGIVGYSSFGLMWQKFGGEICGSKAAADLVEKKLVMAVDAFDNGFDLVENKYEVAPYLIQHLFFAMEPTWKEENENKDDAFLKCVEMAKVVLAREIVQAQDTLLAEGAVIGIYENTQDKRIIVLDQNYPFEYILYKFPEPLFAIYPRKIDNTWGIKAIRENPRTFKNRKNFPAGWAGLRDLELQEITGIPDAIFCHRGLFLAATKSKEGAIKLAQLALNS